MDSLKLKSLKCRLLAVLACLLGVVLLLAMMPARAFGDAGYRGSSSSALAQGSAPAQAMDPGVPTAAGAFQPVAPARLLDTRNTRAVGADSAVSFQVGGASGIPADVSAVVFNLTVTGPRSFGFITAYASGTARPDASNVNFGPGQTIPNSVTVPVGADGKVKLFNRSSGATHLIADVAGYYLPGKPVAAGSFAPVAPARLLDTRNTRAVGADSAVSFQVGGASGIPADASAVVFNLTVTGPRSFGFITAHASGTARPDASNVNFGPGQTIPNSVTVPVGADGKVALFNRSSGTTHLIADVAGYYLPGKPVAAGTFAPVAPERRLDTRRTRAVGADSAVSFQVGGLSGIPADASAVVFNLTVTGPRSFGFITAHASGTFRPNASNVNFGPGQTIPNSVTVPVGASGKVALFNRSSGATHLIADVAGYYLPAQAREPAAVLHVFLAAGQSNMSGRGLPAGGNQDPVNPRIFQYGAKERTFRPASVPLDMHDQATGLSPATTFSRRYLAAQPANVGVLIIPAAHGNTGFSRAADTLTWSAGAASSPRFDLPALAVTQTLKGIAAAEADGYAVDLKGILWHQGENNSRMFTAAYSAELDRLIAYFRTRLAAPELPFVVGRMAPEGIAAVPGRENADRSHLETPSRVAFTGFAPSMAGGVYPRDFTHFSRTGIEHLGTTYLSGYRQAAAIPGPFAQGSLKAQVPAIDGTARVGSVLTAVPGAWGPAPVKLSYRWYRSHLPISGATAPRYKVRSADHGRTITVKVTGAKTGFTTTSRTSAGTRAG